MQPIHTKLLNEAAKRFLRPLGVRQKGRSRLWYDDQGWWIVVIEFQPGWGKGSYLNVGAMWLWHEKSDFSFDYGSRVEGFHSFEDQARFLPVAEGLAKKAAEEVESYRVKFGSLDAVAKCLKEQAAQFPNNLWINFNAAVACGLRGRQDDAEGLFGEVMKATEELDWVQSAVALAREYTSLLKDKRAFRDCIGSVIIRARKALKFDELSEVSFD